MEYAGEIEWQKGQVEEARYNVELCEDELNQAKAEFIEAEKTLEALIAQKCTRVEIWKSYCT